MPVFQSFWYLYLTLGKCNNAGKCKYLHDPKKIKVCTRFLKGCCFTSPCPYSHNLTAEKVPQCLFFSKGLCVRDNCPYVHSKISDDAQICKDFSNGFCPLGSECRNKHILDPLKSSKKDVKHRTEIKIEEKITDSYSVEEGKKEESNRTKIKPSFNLGSQKKTTIPLIK